MQEPRYPRLCQVGVGYSEAVVRSVRHVSGYYRRKSTDIRDRPGAARRQSQVQWSTAPQGGEAVSTAIVARRLEISETLVIH
jgi:hypothetical protein